MCRVEEELRHLTNFEIKKRVEMMENNIRIMKNEEPSIRL